MHKGERGAYLVGSSFSQLSWQTSNAVTDDTELGPLPPGLTHQISITIHLKWKVLFYEIGKGRVGRMELLLICSSAGACQSSETLYFSWKAHELSYRLIVMYWDMP
jgi:hypothetical protein